MPLALITCDFRGDMKQRKIKAIDLVSVVIFGVLSYPLTFVLGYHIMTGRFYVEDSQTILCTTAIIWPLMWGGLVSFYWGLKQKFENRSLKTGKTMFIFFAACASLCSVTAILTQPHLIPLIIVLLVLFFAGSGYLFYAYKYIIP